MGVGRWDADGAPLDVPVKLLQELGWEVLARIDALVVGHKLCARHFPLHLRTQQASSFQDGQILEPGKA